MHFSTGCKESLTPQVVPNIYQSFHLKQKWLPLHFCDIWNKFLPLCVLIIVTLQVHKGQLGSQSMYSWK